MMIGSLRRTFTVIFGIAAIIWAIDAMLVCRAAAPLEDAAQSILSGNKFNSGQLDALKHQLEITPVESLKGSAVSSAAVVRLLILENEAKASAADRDELEGVVSAALTQSPTSSFMWLTDCWLVRRRGEPGLNLLRMSYRYGPNEGWVAVRRNFLAASIFATLPSELREQVVLEFVGLVRSGFYADASNILAGPGRAIHEQLLSGLTRIEESHRRGLARALARRDIYDVSIPGLEERPSRPF
jgi:hypothetical protein